MYITPQEVIDYSTIPEVQNRDPKRLQIDIMRAEAKIDSFLPFNKKLKDIIKDPNNIPDDIKVGIILYAEYYAYKQTFIQKTGMKSETFDDYSYEVMDSGFNLEEPDIMSLFQHYIKVIDTTPVERPVTMRITIV